MEITQNIYLRKSFPDNFKAPIYKCRNIYILKVKNFNMLLKIILVDRPKQLWYFVFAEVILYPWTYMPSFYVDLPSFYIILFVTTSIIECKFLTSHLQFKGSNQAISFNSHHSGVELIYYFSVRHCDALNSSKKYFISLLYAFFV